MRWYDGTSSNYRPLGPRRGDRRWSVRIPWGTKKKKRRKFWSNDICQMPTCQMPTAMQHSLSLVFFLTEERTQHDCMSQAGEEDSICRCTGRHLSLVRAQQSCCDIIMDKGSDHHFSRGSRRRRRQALDEADLFFHFSSAVAAEAAASSYSLITWQTRRN